METITKSAKITTVRTIAHKSDRGVAKHADVALLFYVHGKHLRSCRDGQ